MDIVASLYDRNSLSDIVRRTAEQRVHSDHGRRRHPLARRRARRCCAAGADKVAINTAAVARPELITRGRATASARNAWCCRSRPSAPATGGWEAYTDNGREHTGLDVVEWAKRAVELGAGEMLLTSVDREGTRKGFDIELTRAVADAVSVPVIASGGMGTLEHLVEVVRDGHADAVAMADVLHYRRLSLARHPRRRAAGRDRGEEQ